jgi:arylsulfatase A-like enzyme
MLTGLDPAGHGVVHPSLKLTPATPLLAESLRDAGYRTFGVTDGGYVSARYGFDRGFDAFSEEASAFDEKLGRVLAALAAPERTGPLFAFVHTYDVHCPYEPTELFRGTFTSPGSEFVETIGRCGNPDFNAMELTAGQVRYLSDRYDESVREADADLGDFVRALEAGGWMSNTILVVTSDHGEEFGEHGQIGHERSLHREVLLVPWIAVGPSWKARRVSTPVALADLAPAILDWAGVRPLPHPLETAPARALFSELSWQSRLISMFTTDTHLIVDLEARELELYRWREDPAESRDVAEELPEVVQDLLPKLRHYRSRGEVPQAALTGGLEPEHVERLRSLGYAQ